MSASAAVLEEVRALSFEELRAAIAGTAAAFRSVTKLQPVGGEGVPRACRTGAAEPGSGRQGERRG
jgi:hypothetical protein